MEKPRIVFMGSPEIATPTLCALAADYSVIGVVTQPDRPAGRGNKLVKPAIKIAAEELNIPLIQPDKIRKPEYIEFLQTWAPDLIVVMAYGQILRANILELPKLGCINVHASLLPRWRGASPIQAAILHGDQETGVTIMRMDAGVDTGPTLSRRSLPIAENETAETLSTKLSLAGAELLMETLPGYLCGDISPVPQSEEGVSFTGLIKKQDGELDFSRSAISLERKIRAFTPWPSAFFILNGEPLKVLKAHVSHYSGNFDFGDRLIKDGLPAVVAADGLLILDEVQPAGRKSMDGKAFLSGRRDWVEEMK